MMGEWWQLFIAPAHDEHLLLHGDVDEEANVKDEDSRRNEEKDSNKIPPIHFLVWSQTLIHNDNYMSELFR